MQRPRTVTFASEVTRLRVLDVVYPAETDFDTHVHDETYACLVVEGAYEEWSPGRRRVPRGTDQLWRAGSRHSVRTGEKPVRILHLADPDDTDLLDSCPSSGATLWQIAWALRGSGDADRDDARRLHLESLVAEITGPTDGEGSSGSPTTAAARETGMTRTAARRTGVRRADSWLEAARARLRDGYGDPASLEELARVAGRHPAHVVRAFRERWGLTPGEYVRRVRVAEAIRMLRHGRESLSAVAFATGFADQSHMGRWIRRYTGSTPGQLRGAGRRH